MSAIHNKNEQRIPHRCVPTLTRLMILLSLLGAVVVGSVAGQSVTGLTNDTFDMVNVVSRDAYTIPFRIVGDSVAKEQSLATGIIHGDFDGDALPEIVFAPLLDMDHESSIRIYEYDGFDSFQQTASAGFGGGWFNGGMSASYLNGDQNLDIAMMVGYELYILQGNGDNTFSAGDPAPILTIDMLPPSLSNFNNDAHLDYLMIGHDAMNGSRLYVYLGTDGSHFVEGPVFDIGPEQSFNNEVTMYGINSDDFDGDGWDDLAVSTKDGLEIYLNDQVGGYTIAHLYPLGYPPVDVVVTSQGTDFNNDGICDLLLTVPTDAYPWSANDTRIMVFYGNGDGTFVAAEISDVEGLCWASRGCDLNDDGHLDIVYANYDEQYIGILFNAGDGSFAEESTVAVPRVQPYRMDCVDIDIDGDFDIILTGERRGSEAGDYEHWRYLFINESDPAGLFQSDLRVAVTDAAVEIVAPNGGRLSEITRAIPSGEYYECRIDENDLLDGVATVAIFRPGRYDLVVGPKDGGGTGGTFSLDWQLDGTAYRLAPNLPIPSDSYVFPFFPDGNSGVRPVQGGCVSAGHPLFEWDSVAVPQYEMGSTLPITDIRFEFRMATDPNFDDIVEATVLTGTQYYLQATLNSTDSTAYFWQFRLEGDPVWGPIYTFWSVPAGEDHVKYPEDRDSDSDVGWGSRGPDGPASESADATQFDVKIGVPGSFGLSQNHPNPFNPMTDIRYSVPKAGSVRLEVYNILGHRVATLVDEHRNPGYYVATWDASSVASGIYLYRLTAGEFVATKKMVVMK
jgi:hypothetical protein